MFNTVTPNLFKMNTTFNNKYSEEIKIRPYTGKELAGLYGVSTRTLRSWLEPHKDSIGIRTSKVFTVKQVKIIFEKIGEP